MQNNPEIEQIVDHAVKIARELRHEYVLTEHVLLALIQYQPFKAVVEKYGADATSLENDVLSYLTAIEHMTSKEVGAQPKKTNALERVFNRALTQVLFTGRRSITTADLYLAMMSETNSHAHYFLLKYGITKTEFLKYWDQHYKHNDFSLSNEQADDILTEYCTNITALAMQDRLEPVIGRTDEIDEIVTVLARRFKANVLMVGDPGVGKTAIIDGLAQRIATDDVPEFLKGHEVWRLEIG